MSYLHINNLYKDTRILAFRECYAMEKIHGTSATVMWRDGKVVFFSGGATHSLFVRIFDIPALTAAFVAVGHPDVTVYGEAYGGKMQSMKDTYGPVLRFVAFEVRIDRTWLDVPNANDVAAKLGLDFVPWRKVPTELHILDAERDAHSEQALKLSMGEHLREGVVLRPPFEVVGSNGERIIAKHKADAFKETKTHREVDPEKQVLLTAADDISLEWATPMRLQHVLDAFSDANIEQTGDVIRAMIADIEREGAGELLMTRTEESGDKMVLTREAKAAIGRRTAQLFKAHLRSNLENNHA
jgi:hypothetical protein